MIKLNNIQSHVSDPEAATHCTFRWFIAGMRNMVLICMLWFSFLAAEAQTSGNIKATALVVEPTGIQLIPLEDMVIDESSSKDGFLNISPVTDEKAGKILVRGKAKSSVKLSYMNEMSLANPDGEGKLVCEYSVSGYQSDNQSASQPLDQVERVVQFNEKGEYYLWLGGKINFTHARPGSYEGEFTIQVEYI
jgi:hypothetical protein